MSGDQLCGATLKVCLRRSTTLHLLRCQRQAGHGGDHVATEGSEWEARPGGKSGELRAIVQRQNLVPPPTTATTAAQCRSVLNGVGLRCVLREHGADRDHTSRGLEWVDSEARTLARDA